MIACKVSLHLTINFNHRAIAAVVVLNFNSFSLSHGLYSFELIKSAIGCQFFLLLSSSYSSCVSLHSQLARRSFHSIQFFLPSSSVRIRVNSKASFLNHLRDFFFIFGCVKWNLSSHCRCCAADEQAESERRFWERQKKIQRIYFANFLQPSGIKYDIVISNIRILFTNVAFLAHATGQVVALPDKPNPRGPKGTFSCARPKYLPA